MAALIPTPFIRSLTANLKDTPQFIQVILGPRQVGKTTGVLRLLKATKSPNFYFSADDALAPAASWIEDQWQRAQQLGVNCTVAIDEIQRIPDWSSVVKKIWDRQARTHGPKIKLILLGSSSLRLHQGLTESLAGRFQLIEARHWDLASSRKLRKMSVADFITFGGYPGSYALLNKRGAWAAFTQKSIIDSVIGKDILQIARVASPALFRQAFTILTSYPAQEISYTKLLGQLQDRGNTDLIKYYIELYEAAFLIKAIQKFSGKTLVSRASSPEASSPVRSVDWP